MNNEVKLTLDLLNKMKPGDQVIFNLFGRDNVLAFACKTQEDKYNCIGLDGIRQRSLGMSNGALKFVTAKEDSGKPDDKCWHYDFTGFGSMMLKDYDLDESVKFFNIRAITKDHPMYDKSLASEGRQFNALIDFAKVLFGEDE